jgi:hypothetical protein
MKIKDFYLSVLNESKENFFYLDKDAISSIDDVDLSKDDNFIKISFTTTYGKPMNVVSNYDEFKNWYHNNKKAGGESSNIFKDYVSKFITNSKETEPFFTMNEIVDDNGDIMASTDLPNNSTNTMVGSKLRWDLEKVYRSAVPKSIRFYSGDLGIGIITW